MQPIWPNNSLWAKPEDDSDFTEEVLAAEKWEVTSDGTSSANSSRYIFMIVSPEEKIYL